ncbi:AMP-binding protein, partial [Streptomyces sp. PGLac3x]
YGELDRRANARARRLRALGTGPGTVVGVQLEKAPELIVTLLAVLKAGGAYLPLDPALPADRTAQVLAGAGAGLLVTGPGTAGTPTG